MKDGLKLVLYNQCLYIKFDISHFSRCVLPSLYLYDLTVVSVGVTVHFASRSTRLFQTIRHDNYTF